MPRNVRDNSDILAPAIAVTNWNQDLALDADSTSDGELADVLGTVIKQLQEQGILNGTVLTA